MIINLLDYTKGDHPFGNAQGKEVFRKLVELVESNSSVDIFRVSLSGIEATDASFPRESVIALAKHFRCEKGFYLTDVADRDLIDNWMYGAKAKDQPLVVWSGNEYEIIGPEMNSAGKSLVGFILERKEVTTSLVANEFDLSAANASTRLKKLFNSGYIMRSEEVAESGGKEFVYKAIK